MAPPSPLPLISCLFAFLAGGCGWHHPRDTTEMFATAPPVIGHRGARGLAPENTLAAFAVAAELGVPFELDTMRCASGEAVVIHDETLERTTSGQGAVAEASLAALRDLDAGVHFGADFEGEPLPTLAEVLDTFGGAVLVDIEVKSGKGADDAALAEAVVTEVEERGLVHDVFVTSFSPFLLEQVRLRNPEIARGQLYGTFEDSDLAFYERYLLRRLAFNRKARPDVLAMEDALARPRYIRRMKRRGYTVLVWTVNDPARARALWDMGVDAVITDYPDRLLEEAARAGAAVP